MSRVNWPAIVVVVSLVGCTGEASPPPSSGEPALPLRMNHIQSVGSHNSYKEDIDPSLKLILDDRLPGGIDGLEYHHVSLTEQLELGLRKLELDVFHDPEGGRYAEPGGIAEVTKRAMPPGPPFDPHGVMRRPGFKVLHVQDVDFRSNCLTLELCLEEIKNWSDANPTHVPIVITVNAKDGSVPWPGFVEPFSFDAPVLAALDSAIVRSLGRQKLLIPDDVRGEFESLEEAVILNGWPEIDAVRGRILFVLDEGGKKQELYIRGHPSLKGRVMFVNAEEGSAEAAFRIVNDPIKDGEYIKRLVETGYLVRTRADANTSEARSGSYERLEAAIASGAHYISTDYYLPDSLFGHGFHVRLAGDRFLQCNQATAPAGCEISE